MNIASEFAGSEDQYKTICVSTAHIRDIDMDKLRQEGEGPDRSMIIARDTGAFVKLFADIEGEDERVLEEDYPGYSDAFYTVLAHAKKAGFTLIEFDFDATVYSSLPTFGW